MTPHKTHTYATSLTWSGSTGAGYRGYSRDHVVVAAPAVHALELSADPAFRGDPTRLNPEQLLVAAASSCQLLSFLALAARERVDVRAYEDPATGTLDLAANRPRITRVDLHPVITVGSGADHETVRRLMRAAHDECYIANSLSTEVVADVTVVDA